jgi:hypothetical protein
LWTKLIAFDNRISILRLIQLARSDRDLPIARLECDDLEGAGQVPADFKDLAAPMPDLQATEFRRERVWPERFVKFYEKASDAELPEVLLFALELDNAFELFRAHKPEGDPADRLRSLQPPSRSARFIIGGPR